jgi:SSS family transporter
METTLHAADVLIIAAYLLALAGVGVYFSRQQTSLDGYLMAGHGMAWLPVGLSLMAALNSGIDYLTQPGATIRYGLILTVGPLSWLVVYLWVSKIAFPFYHRLQFYSAYEYLEARFDVRVRTLGALIFILWRLGWMATAMYVPSLAVHAVSGGAVDLTLMIVVLGSLVTLYVMLGGIRAVIWNDVIQFCVMFGGLSATVAIVLASVPGGLGEIWHTAAAAGKTGFWVPVTSPAADSLGAQLQYFFSQPVTVPALMAALIVGRMAQYTSDQVMVQRLQTTRTVQDARQAFALHAGGDALWMLGLSFVGLALFAYFQHHVLPDGFDSDRMLPHFMAQAFPIGATGLVVAAILAASLSSIDSAMHSCSSVAVVDVYNRLLLGRDVASRTLTDDEQRHQIRASRVATLIVGALGTTLACNVAQIGNLLEIANKLINAFTGPLFGIFLLAMFSTRARSGGVLAGGAAGAVASYYVAYHSGLSFLWPSTFGLAATLSVGMGATLLAPASSSEAARSLTWREVMKRPAREEAGRGSGVAL